MGILVLLALLADLVLYLLFFATAVSLPVDFLDLWGLIFTLGDFCSLLVSLFLVLLVSTIMVVLSSLFLPSYLSLHITVSTKQRKHKLGTAAFYPFQYQISFSWEGLAKRYVVQRQEKPH